MRASTLLFTCSSRTLGFRQSTNHMSAKRLKLSSMAPPRQSSGSAIVQFYDPDVQAKDSLGRTQDQILAWSNSQLEYSHNYIQMLFPLPEGSPYNWSAPVIDLETMRAFRAESGLRQQLRKSFERMLTFYGFTTSTRPETENENNDAEKQTQAEETTPKPSSATDPLEEDNQNGHAPPSAAIGDISTTENTAEAATTEPLTAGPESAKPTSTSQASPPGYFVIRGPNWRKASRSWCVRIDHNHLRITRILRCLRVLGLQTECDAFFAALKRAYDDPNIMIGERSLMYWTRAVERPLFIAPDNDKCEWLKAWEREQESTE